jgi:hypothetical protein
VRPAGRRDEQERAGLRLACRRPRTRPALDGRPRAVRSRQPGAEPARLRRVALGGVRGHRDAGGQGRRPRRPTR